MRYWSGALRILGNIRDMLSRIYVGVDVRIYRHYSKDGCGIAGRADMVNEIGRHC